MDFVHPTQSSIARSDVNIIQGVKAKTLKCCPLPSPPRTFCLYGGGMRTNNVNPGLINPVDFDRGMSPVPVGIQTTFGGNAPGKQLGRVFINPGSTLRGEH